VLSSETWTGLIAALAEEPSAALLALWADTVQVHALLQDTISSELLLASTAVVAGGYPALSPVRPLAAWFERLVHDLWGHTASGGTDLRPWLDHGRWPHAQPMAPRHGVGGGSPEPPEFLTEPDENLHQIPLGPIHAGIAAASHLRLTGRGEAIVRLEARLGYAHKGTLILMRGKSPRTSARFAARLAAESTVAHSIAFARATEAALAIEPPPLALALRGVMAEIERIVGHLDDLAGIGRSAGFAVLAERCARLQEAMHRAAGVAFGHRLMMDCVIPGGVAAAITPGGPEAIRRAITSLQEGFPELERLQDASALAGRLPGLGIISTVEAASFAAGGVVGRAAGYGSDVRRLPGYAPYDALGVAVLVEATGDAAARARLRLREIAESIRVLHALLASLPDGAVSVPLPTESGEGVGYAEGFRGDIWHWLRLDHGQIASVFMRDPGWAHWPLFEATAVGCEVADIPLIQASFGLASSGVDL
jgi:Ni,Fe-hydrogenase III large subunit